MNAGATPFCSLPRASKTIGKTLGEPKVGNRRVRHLGIVVVEFCSVLQVWPADKQECSYSIGPYTSPAFLSIGSTAAVPLDTYGRIGLHEGLQLLVRDFVCVPDDIHVELAVIQHMLRDGTAEGKCLNPTKTHAFEPKVVLKPSDPQRG